MMNIARKANEVWLITGATSGLGMEMALAALRAGRRVIGTGRNVARASAEQPGFEELGGQWLQLDIAQVDSQTILQRAVKDEEKRVGPNSPIHWVVVNNAGSTLLGVTEDMSEGQMMDYLQTNLFGAIRVWKAMLPAMRRHRQGTLITISSVWGIVPKPENMMYSAAKAATESLTESYANLLGPLGIRTMLVEPGGFRTSFPSNNTKADGGVTDDYRESVTKWMEIVDAAGKDPNMVSGSPALFGQRILEAVDGAGAFRDIWSEQPPDKALRIPLGTDCYSLLGDRLEDIRAGYGKMAAIAKSTDVSEF